MPCRIRLNSSEVQHLTQCCDVALHRTWLQIDGDRRHERINVCGLDGLGKSITERGQDTGEM